MISLKRPAKDEPEGAVAVETENPNRKRDRAKGPKTSRSKTARAEKATLKQTRPKTLKAQQREAARAEMAAAKERGEGPKMMGRSGRPKLHLSRHSTTTAHSCTLYPWGVHGSLGYEGPYLGADTLGGGGAFCFDAFEAYNTLASTGSVTNTNMMILGRPGMGKSALIKTLLYRTSAIYGKRRFLAIVDVKGEYAPLAEMLDIPIVKLSPGGLTRVNPLEVRGDTDHRVVRQAAMMQALTSTMLGRPLTQIEDVALWNGVEAIGAIEEPTVADLSQQLANPSEKAAKQARLSVPEFAERTMELALAVEGLLKRSLAGMFDGKSTVDIDPHGPGVVIDISDVHQQDQALPLVMVAATAWLQQILTENTESQKIQILDECWRMVSFEGTARYLQACWKLGRTFGVANVAILHKPGDLASQSADGSATAKISQGLVADTAVRVSFAQTAKDLDQYGDLLGYGPGEKATIAELGRGQSFWKIGTHSVRLQHTLPKDGPEAILCNTDDAILGLETV